MSGALKKTMVLLGLTEGQDRYDDEYEEYYDDEDEFEPLMLDDEQERSAPVTPISRGVTRMVPRVAAEEMHRIATIHPRSFNEAKEIGECFRNGTPVIVNLTEMSDADAKRIVDFASGLIFGLHGALERVTNKVFLLSPAHVEIDVSERHNENQMFD